MRSITGSGFYIFIGLAMAAPSIGYGYKQVADNFCFTAMGVAGITLIIYGIFEFMVGEE